MAVRTPVTSGAFAIAVLHPGEVSDLITTGCVEAVAVHPAQQITAARAA